MKTFLNSIFNKLLDKEHHNKSLLNKILRILLMFVVLAIVLYPFVYYCLICLIFAPSFFAIKYLCENAPMLMCIGVIWLILILSIYLLLRYKISIKSNIAPILRTVWFRLLQYCSIYLVIVSAIYIPSAFSVYGDWSIGSINTASTGYGLFLLTLLNIAIAYNITNYGVMGRIYYVTIPKIKYNFFLRPFYKDSCLKVDDEIEKYFPEELVEIADPTSKYGNKDFKGSSLFLPTTDWKRELSYYIRRANIVFCTIGPSDGVQWEMFEHDELLDKYIFYKDKTMSCGDIIDNVSSEKHQVSRVYRALLMLSTMNIKDEYYFIIRGSLCYYSAELECIASFVKTNEDGDLKSFEITEDSGCNKNVPKCTNEENNRFKYFNRDLGRIISIIFRPKALVTYITTILGTVLLIINLALLLAGILLVIFGLITLLSLIWPSLRDCLYWTTTSEIVGYGIGSIILGIGLIKTWND